MMHLLLDREGSLWQPRMRMLLTCLKLTLPTMQSSFSTTRNSNRHIWALHVLGQAGCSNTQPTTPVPVSTRLPCSKGSVQACHGRSCGTHITASLVSRVHDKHRGAVGLAACHCAGLLSCPLLLRIRCAGLLHRNWHRRPRLLQGHAAVALFSCRSDKAAYTALDRLHSGSSGTGGQQSERAWDRQQGILPALKDKQANSEPDRWRRHPSAQACTRSLA